MEEKAFYTECDKQESLGCSDSVAKELWTWMDHGYFPGDDRCLVWCQKGPFTTPFH